MGAFAKEDFDAWSQLDSFRMRNKFSVEKGAVGRFEVDYMAEFVVIAPEGDGVLTGDGRVADKYVGGCEVATENDKRDIGEKVDEADCFARAEGNFTEAVVVMGG